MNIPNRLPDITPLAREQDFIDEMASLLATWGVPATAGRLHAYLLLRADPVSLEQIAADLDMSKAGAWNAARFLEQAGSARRSTERGSKRVFFRIANDMAPCMLDQLRSLGDIGRLMRTMGPEIADAAIDDRLQRVADSCLSIERTILQILSRRAGDDMATPQPA